MKKRWLLSCPEVNTNSEQRINELAITVSDWIDSEAFIQLILLFGGSPSSAGSIKKRIEYYNDFADVWDYRKHTANGGERWLIAEDQFLSEHKSEIMECMFLLGLAEATEPKKQPDYILPLGGARMANLDRCLGAHEVCQMYKGIPIPVVALTGMRPINEIERESLKKYAPAAKTEYEAICCGIEKAFALPEDSYSESIYSDDNINLQWAERVYNCDQRRISVLSAPSSDPDRRANSMDTFKFFLKRYELKEGTKILLVTSPVYAPFQLMKFTDLALERGFYVDCIGNRHYGNSPTVLNAASYLQELKATINAIYTLAEKYFI